MGFIRGDAYSDALEDILLTEASPQKPYKRNLAMLRILLCGTFLLQDRALSVVVLQLRVLGPEV